jgi:GxxExxY protein
MGPRINANQREWEEGMREDLILKDEVYAIAGAGMEVHSVLGSGFAEAVYQEAMEMELGWRRIPLEPQRKLLIRYKNRQLKKYYSADFVCFGQILVEIKAEDRIYPRDELQLLNYLKATGLQLGLIMNFGHYAKLEWNRRILTPHGAIDPDEPID